MHLPAEVHSLTRSLLNGLQTRISLHISQKNLNILFQHGNSTLAQLKSPVMLFQLRQDGAMLKLQLNENPSQLQKYLFLGRFR